MNLSQHGGHVPGIVNSTHATWAVLEPGLSPTVSARKKTKAPRQHGQFRSNRCGIAGTGANGGI